MRPLFIVTLPLLLTSAVLAQTTYFVDAANGSDANPGTSRTAAFRSLTFGASVVADDDTLIVLPGTYSSSATGEAFPIQLGVTGTSQKRVKIYAEGGPNATVLDGEQQASSSTIPLIRFYSESEGSSLTGMTFVNTGSASYWSMAIRIGSPSGGNLAAKDIEIHGCVFANVHRAVVIFGSDPNTGAQSDGCKIHDNLIDTTSHRALAVWGPGQNFAYNNTLINPGQDGIWVDSLPSQAPSNAVINNNIVVGGVGTGISAGVQGTTAIFENNNAFNNAGGDYTGMTFSGSNTSVDPMFVGGGDYHLQAGSPMIQSGTIIGLPIIRVDLDRFSRLHDSDGNGLAGIDRGAYQYTQYGMTISGNWAPGQTVNFNFVAPVTGAGLLLFSLRDGTLPFNPWGVFGVSLPFLLASSVVGQVPASVPITIPNSAGLFGLRMVIQGGYVGPGATPIHLLNVEDRTF